MTRQACVLLVASAFGCVACAGSGAKRPETPRIRAAYEHLALACQQTGPEADEVLLKTWLAVHGRYPYETNLLRAIAESPPDANGMYYGELTTDEGRTIESCRARADRIAGIAQ